MIHDAGAGARRRGGGLGRGVGAGVGVAYSNPKETKTQNQPTERVGSRPKGVGGSGAAMHELTLSSAQPQSVLCRGLMQLTSPSLI